MFQISEVQESPAFNGRRSFLTLRGHDLLIDGSRLAPCDQAAVTPTRFDSESQPVLM